MMDNKIKSTLEYITPTEEQQERMLRGIKGQMNNRPRRTAAYALRIAAVAAVLCCLFTMTVFADEIGDFFAGIFTENEIVGDTVKTGVFTDSDGHVEMTVEELLSDMCSVRMVVHYRALDEQGREWLDSLSSYNKYYTEYSNYGLNIEPDFKDNNTDLYGVNWGFYTEEYEEYRTDDQRRFVVAMDANDDSWGTPNVKLNYAMSDGIRTALLDVTTNIEKRVFALDLFIAADKMYTPTEVTLTPLSLIIRGEIAEGSGGKVQGDECSVDSLYLIFESGVKRDPYSSNRLINGSVSSIHVGRGYIAEVGSYTIAATHFREPMELDKLAGIELDGVYYPFE